MKNELKSLWRLCFGDSAEYTEFYFSRRYTPENTRVFRADGRIVSAAQYRGYEISYFGRILKAVYILGVCTHPDYRLRGYTSELIRRILREQYALGAELAFLIPQEPYLFGVYEKFGFGPLFTVYEGPVETADGDGQVYEPEAAALFEFCASQYAALDSAVLKDYDDFLFAMDDIRLSGGRILACRRNGRLEAFAGIEGRCVKELLGSEPACGRLLRELLRDGPLSVITPRPRRGAIEKTIGMARVLRPKAFLEKTAKESAIIEIADSILEQNTGVYTVTPQGVAYSSGSRGKAMRVSALTGFMGRSYANLLLN